MSWPHRAPRPACAEGFERALLIQRPLDTPEVRRLVYRLVVRILTPPEAVLHWSRWGRLHQARAMRSHYRTRRRARRRVR